MDECHPVREDPRNPSGALRTGSVVPRSVSVFGLSRVDAVFRLLLDCSALGRKSGVGEGEGREKGGVCRGWQCRRRSEQQHWLEKSRRESQVFVGGRGYGLLAWLLATARGALTLVAAPIGGKHSGSRGGAHRVCRTGVGCTEVDVLRWGVFGRRRLRYSENAF